MSLNMDLEITQLRSVVDDLVVRVQELEDRDVSREIARAARQKKREAAREQAAEADAPIKMAPAVRTLAKPSPSNQAAPAEETESSNNQTSSSKQSAEVWFGRNLNKFGIAFVVIGCCLAILYEFQYFTPLMKILCGIFIGASMIWGGDWIQAKPGLQWYGRGITAGGWALAYFSTFAAYHYDSVRVIDSQLVDLGMLLIVSGAAIWHSVKYKSEVVTTISLSLAFLTIIFSPISWFTALSTALLATTVCVLSMRSNWYYLFNFGIVLIYALSVLYVIPSLISNNAWSFLKPQDAEFSLPSIFLVYCWAAFNAVILAFDKVPESSRRSLIVATLFNSLAFVPVMLSLMHGAHESLRLPFMMAMAAAYGLTVPHAQRNKNTGFADMHTILSLAFGTYAISIHFSGIALGTLWCIEVPLLVWAGLYYDIKAVRWFAVCLAVIAGFYVHTHRDVVESAQTIVDLTALACFAGAAALHRMPALRAASNLINQVSFRYYFAVSTLFLWTITASHFAWLNRPMIYSAECFAIIAFGFYLKDQFVRTMGTVGMLFVICILMMQAGAWLTAPTFLVIAMFYCSSEMFKRCKIESFDLGTDSIYSACATLSLTKLLSQVFDHTWLSVAWSFEGIALLIAGFALRDKLYRMSGLAVLALVSCKLVFVDLSHTEGIERIVSFMSAGLILLVSSLAYAKLNTQNKPEPTSQKAS